jgi:hypothetical protein
MLDQITPPTKTRRVKIPSLALKEIEALRNGDGLLAVPPEIIRITRPKLRTAAIQIRGISPYVQHAFSEKQRKQMEETQRSGQQGRSKKPRQPKDFEQVFEAAKHYAKAATGAKPWVGIPAPAFRNACIDACRLCGFKMTHAKCSIFVEADGIDAVSGQGLVRIVGEPRIHESAVRNESGVADIRWRPMWEQWSATVRITWDEDQFSSTDILNLMLRAGLQVGIGEGRPFSPNSNGLGWGRFEIVE